MARKDPVKASEIRQQIKLWDDNWKYNRDQYHLFMTFVMGDQWTEDESDTFKNYRKMPLTRNKLAPLIAHLLGEQRQNTPNLQCWPEDAVSAETVDVREALVKDISLSSNAKIKYQTAFQQAAIGGFGAYGIITAYDNNRTFNQHPEFIDFKDPTRCYWDVGAQTPCKTDGMVGGYRTRMMRKRFGAVYGKSLEKKIPTSNGENTYLPVADDDSITVIDHFERIYETETIYQLSNGETVTAKELKNLEMLEMEGGKVYLFGGEPVTVEESRSVPVYKIMHSIWAGDYELDANEFPSQQLPIIFVDQNSYWDKKGRQICRPFVKDAKDAQKYLNYLFTQSAYLLKISRYDQFMASRANVQSPDSQQQWRDPATVKGTLFYDESPNGNKPEQLRPPELSQSFIHQYEQTMMDIQSSTGMYNTQLGENGNEVSGKAINARTRRGSYNTFVPFDSLNRSIAVGGEIVDEMIPRLYDTERKIKLNMKDKGMTDITLNERVDEYGGGIKNNMKEGRFKIRLVPGPSYEGQKQEALDSFNMVLQADRTGQVFPMIADLYVENLPLANNIELKNRLRVLVPPEIIEAGKTGQPLPPKQPQEDPMIKIKQMELEIKMANAQMEHQAKMSQIALDEQKLSLMAHQQGVDFSKEIEKLKMQREIEETRMKEVEMRADAEMQRINADMHMNHSQNIVKILTHQPNHFKAPKETTHANT